VSRLLADAGGVGSGSEAGCGLDGAIGQAGQDGEQIVAHRNSWPAAAFDDRKDGGYAWIGLRASDVGQFPLPVATGRIEFSVRWFERTSCG